MNGEIESRFMDFAPYPDLAQKLFSFIDLWLNKAGRAGVDLYIARGRWEQLLGLGEPTAEHRRTIEQAVENYISRVESRAMEKYRDPLWQDWWGKFKNYIIWSGQRPIEENGAIQYQHATKNQATNWG